jgi:hypothetical protein
MIIFSQIQGEILAAGKTNSERQGKSNEFKI